MKVPIVLLLLGGLAAAGPLTAGRTGENRAKLLRARGGSAATEKAVAAALEWLAKHQSPGGLWDADGFMDVHDCECDGKGGGWHGEPVPCPFDAEVTGLATLAFLGAGHTHREGEHRETVARALGALRGRGGGTLFATAFATQALAEAYDLTGDEELRPAVERGVETMLSSQQPEGGWRYSPGMRMASGVPTTTAVVRALRVAEEAGFRVPESYRKPVLTWLDRMVDRETGKVRYTSDAHEQGMTPTTTNAGSALVIYGLLGVPATHARVRDCLGAVNKTRPRWRIRFKTMRVKGVERRVQIGYLQHYYWEHGTDALARYGGSAWSAWNGALKKALLGKQEKTGHAAGSWDPVGTYGPVGGRVFSTALCALCLESYYRYP